MNFGETRRLIDRRAPIVYIELNKGLIRIVAYISWNTSDWTNCIVWIEFIQIGYFRNAKSVLSFISQQYFANLFDKI